MSQNAYDLLFRFRGNQVHDDIVEKYHKTHPEYPKKADVFRHAIALLDQEMRKQTGQDEMSVVIKKLGDLELANKELKHSNNALRVQMDVLIRLIMEVVSRSGSDLTWEAAEQEVRDKIGSAVTKKSEGRFAGTTNRMQPNTKLEGTVATLSVQEIDSQFQGNVVTPGIHKIQQQPFMSQKQLPMISEEDKIVMKYGKPHKVVIERGRPMYDELEWEQVPEHRRSELR